ncbi:wall-associated receptor kinase 5-like [Pyrus ussuriensis x Pyrus communis]|uniref:Wall-associated receptor kinase 5-like n=1 Tax=Pyrus ussuriensis x Pyrus communis TaxID=2448454 RepID=A0A5N5F492_9ROSA|nr:wall-associated receptor kinase 5-like [Pyrus ussuriensis x Pyrus communis]
MYSPATRPCLTTFIMLMGKKTSKPMIIHGNVNSSNILLSDCFVAKVFGFGSSRLVRVPSNESQMNTLVQQTLTDKSDVYSFGDVLLEILTGEMPLSFNRPENRRIITSHFVSSVEQNDIFQMVVPLVNEGNREQLRAVAEPAKSCLKLSSAERPAMEEVAGELRRLCSSTHSS